MKNLFSIFMFIVFSSLVSEAYLVPGPGSGNPYPGYGPSYPSYPPPQQCLHTATINTGLYIYHGTGYSDFNAQQDAINNCVRNGTIASFCTQAMVSFDIEAACKNPYQHQFQCTVNTGLYVYSGSGSSIYNAQQDAINKCVQSGTIASFCTGGNFSCQ